MVPRLSGRVDIGTGTRQGIQPTAAPSIAYVPQRNTVDWDFPTTVFDLVLMGTYGRLKWFRRPGKREREEALAALRKVSMEDFCDRQIGELSGGQQQRVFLARAFVEHASIYLMDEPFAGVNPALIERLIEITFELNRTRGKTFLLISHDIPSVMKLCKNLTVLSAGTTIAEGESEKIRHDPAVIDAYLGEASEKAQLEGVSVAEGS